MKLTIELHDPRQELPDDEVTVLLFLDENEVETGYHENGYWWLGHEGILQDSEVIAWAHIPSLPTPTLEAPLTFPELIDRVTGKNSKTSDTAAT